MRPTKVVGLEWKELVACAFTTMPGVTNSHLGVGPTLSMSRGSENLVMTLLSSLLLAVLGPQQYFAEDRFIGELNRSLWSITSNEAVLRSDGQELRLGPNPTSTGFPEIRIHEGALPAIGDWTLCVEFRIVSVGNYGAGIDLRGGEFGLRTWGDKNCGGMIVGMTGEVTERGVWKDTTQTLLINEPSKWHTWKVVKRGSTLELELDGSRLASVKAPAEQLRLIIGNNVNGLKPWDWTTLGLRKVRIDYSGDSAPEWLAKAMASASSPKTLSENGWLPDLLLYKDGMKWTYEVTLTNSSDNWMFPHRETITLKSRGSDEKYNLFTATQTAPNMDRFESDWPENRIRSTIASGGVVPTPFVEPILEVRFKQDRITRDVIFEAKRSLNSPTRSSSWVTDGNGFLILPGSWDNRTSFTGGLINFVPSPHAKDSKLFFRFDREEVMKINGKQTKVKVYKKNGLTDPRFWSEYWVDPAWGNALRSVNGGFGDGGDTVIQLVEAVFPK